MLDDNNDPIVEVKKRISSKMIINILAGLAVFILGVIYIRRNRLINGAKILGMGPYIIIGLMVACVGMFLIQRDEKKILTLLKFLGVWFVVGIGLVFVSIMAFVFPVNVHDKVNHIELEGIMIPTLYKYTQYENDIILDTIDKSVEDGVELNVVTIMYKDSVPNMFIKDFTTGLESEGYIAVPDINEIMYVKNHPDNKFSYIFITANSREIEYGASSDGSYELILDMIKK